jgi:hypothetical protein
MSAKRYIFALIFRYNSSARHLSETAGVICSRYLFIKPVPEGIVAFLDVKEGDKLQWKMDIKDSERVAIE